MESQFFSFSARCAEEGIPDFPAVGAAGGGRMIFLDNVKTFT
jgi:hypothetical protein